MFNNSRAITRLAPLGIGLIIALIMVAKGCQEGPFGRSQLVQMSPQEELQLGKQAYLQILSQSPARELRNEALSDRVRAIGIRLAQAAKHPHVKEILHQKGERPYEWEFRVLDSKQINAFCLPGGKVVVYTGIIPVAETDAGLAVVMGHEIGHALARHGAERMAQQQLVQVGQLAVASSLGDLDPQAQRTIMGVLGAGTEVGVLLPFSRSHESEADRIGLTLMAIAGYDPREAPKFWVRMSKATGGSRQAEFLSTHPNPETRTRDLQNWLTESMPWYEKSDHVASSALPRKGEPSRAGYLQPATKKSGKKGPGYQFD